MKDDKISGDQRFTKLTCLSD